MFNPLIDPIFELLHTQQKFEAHTLAHSLIKAQVLPDLDTNPEKNLFKRNFLVMNALYQLQAELIKSDQFLSISTMDISLTPSKNNTLDTLDTLRDYYLDWQNYETDEAEIKALLNDFWTQFLGHKKPSAASLDHDDLSKLRNTWQLPEAFSRQQLSKQWRRLATRHHPDKLGDGERFKQLQHEYEQLKHHAMDDF